MVDIPDDILLLIFETCVHTLKLSPVRLLPVSRRWYALAWLTPGLWTRVYTQVNSINAILRIIETSAVNLRNGGLPLAGSLRSYLDRSCSHNNTVQFPLEIIINWSMDKITGHSSANNGDKHAWASDATETIKHKTEMENRCGFLTRMLLLALSGNYLEGNSEGRSNFQETLPQNSHHHDQAAGSSLQTDSDITFPRNDAHRCKALTINLLEIGYPYIVPCPNDCRLDTLERITLRNICLDLRCGAIAPSLREIDLDTSSSILFDPTLPEIDTVKCFRLCIPPTMKFSGFSVPKINFKGLFTLEIFGGNMASSDSTYYLLEHLQGIFNESNRLPVFTVAPSTFSLLYRMFDGRVTNLRIQTLKLSSENLGLKRMTDSGVLADSIQYSLEFHVTRLLEEMRRLGTTVEGMDATMDSLIQLERSRWEESVMHRTE